MDKYDLHANGVIKLPVGANVGDEFRIVGKMRVNAIAEDRIEVTALGDRAPSYLHGSRNYEMTISDVVVEP